MNFTAAFLLMICLTAGAHGYTQVNLSKKNTTLPKVFVELKKQTGYDFVYSTELIDKAGKISVDFRNVSLEEALVACLKGKGLDYLIVERTVVIKQSAISENIVVEEKRLTIDVSGKVTDKEGNSLQGASITVKGKANLGTKTDANGAFVLKGVEADDVITVSYAEYVSQTFKIGSTTNFMVKMEAEETNLQEVVINKGYYTEKQRLSTGNVGTVKGEDIQRQPVSNVLSAISGRIPGILITQNSGMPGSSFSVQIRGRNSIANGTNPLYVIDGVPYPAQLIHNANPAGGNPLDFINLQDIESFDVLKDADATAIYGSRGANGVILITTKKGKSGKAKLNVNLSHGIAKAPLKVDWMNTKEYLTMRREAFANDAIIPDGSNAPDLLFWNSTDNTDWQKTLIGGTAQFSNASAEVSGGNSNLQFLFGGNYHRQTTVFPFEGADQKGTVHLNINSISLNKKFKLSFTASYQNGNSNLPAVDLIKYINTPPNTPRIINEDGSLNWANSTFNNPFAYTKNKYDSRRTNLVANAIINYELLSGLIFKSSFGTNNMQVNELSTNTIASQNPVSSPKGSCQFINNRSISWIAEPQIIYQKMINGNKIEGLIGTTFQQDVKDGQFLTGGGYNSDALIENIKAAPNVKVDGVTNSVYRYSALFARVQYNYFDKYLINATWRRDGSSRFGSNKQLHDFGSLGFAWIFTNEKVFNRSLPFLSFGKIRGSYGKTGSDQVGDYQFYDLFQPGSIPYQGIIGLNPMGLNNPNLAWEETEKIEFGTVLSFFQNKVDLDVSYYRNTSTNQLINTSLPFTTGFSSIADNRPATVRNFGWEFLLNTKLINKKNIRWSASFNFSIPKNKLVAFPDLENSSYKNSLIIGKPLGVIKVYHYLGVDPSKGVYTFESKTNSFRPNDIVDKNHFINTTPKFYGGLQNTISAGKWQIDLFLNFRKQAGLNYLYTASLLLPGSYLKNFPTDVNNRWQRPGDKTKVQRFTTLNFSGSVYEASTSVSQSDYGFVDASFIRLTNMSVSYQIPESHVRKIHFNNCRIYIQGQNLLTITKYRGMDPENQSLTSLPPLRAVVMGIKFSL